MNAMNALRQSKIWTTLVVLAILGLVSAPVLAAGCCCAAPIHNSHSTLHSASKGDVTAAQTVMNSMPCCRKGSLAAKPIAPQQAAQSHCVLSAVAAPAVQTISRHCACPHVEAQLFIINSAPQKSTFSVSVSSLPAREFILNAPTVRVAQFSLVQAPQPPPLVFASLFGRAPPVC